MTYDPITNFKDSDGVDLGKKLVTKDYLIDVYGSLLDNLAPGFNPTPALWIWGNNDAAQLGVNDTTVRLTPVTTILGGTNWKQVSGGNGHSIGLKTDGTLWNWGSAGSGRLGINDDTTNRLTPVTTILGGTNWKFIAGGNAHSAAIKTDGTLWVWGLNSSGQIGVNDTTDRLTPVTTILGGNNWKFILGGENFTAATKTDGTLWTWGYNVDGRLGVNDTTSRITPVTTILGGNNWKRVSDTSGNTGITAATKIDGTLWLCGRNAYGQLGVNDTTNRLTPVTTILGGTNWKSSNLGGSHTAAIKTDGSLWVWGLGGNGQLGVNDTTNRLTPVTTILGGNNWKRLSFGNNHSTALKTDGTLWTWGINSLGHLGIDDTTDRSTPVTTILGGNNWKSVGSGGAYPIAIQSVDYI